MSLCHCEAQSVGDGRVCQGKLSCGKNRFPLSTHVNVRILRNMYEVVYTGQSEWDYSGLGSMKYASKHPFHTVEDVHDQINRLRADSMFGWSFLSQLFGRKKYVSRLFHTLQWDCYMCLVNDRVPHALACLIIEYCLAPLPDVLWSFLS
jgi:hypothetical protein